LSSFLDNVDSYPEIAPRKLEDAPMPNQYKRLQALVVSGLYVRRGSCGVNFGNLTGIPRLSVILSGRLHLVDRTRWDCVDNGEAGRLGYGRLQGQITLSFVCG